MSVLASAAGRRSVGRHPFTVIDGARSYWYMLSDWRQVRDVRQRHPYPLLQIHPDTARTLGLEEGDWAWIENDRGRILQRVSLFDGVRPDVMHADGQWWYPELGGADPSFFRVWISNMNVLKDDDPAICNEVVGSWPLKRIQARVYKADAAEDRGLVAMIERLGLANGEAMPDLCEKDRDAIRSYSLQAMSWPVAGDDGKGGVGAGADRALQ